MVVQFARWTPRDELEGVETFVLNPRTGEGSYLGEALPRILSLDPEHVLFLEEEPYPRVTLGSSYGENASLLLKHQGAHRCSTCAGIR